MENLGTRAKTIQKHTHPAESAPNNALTRDIGMSKLVTASVTFSAGTGKATAAAGTFANFATNDQIVIIGSAANNGFYTVTATDNSTYLTLDPPPKNGGPVTVTIRTP